MAQVIEKARAPWRRTRTFQRLDALHRRMGSVVQADLTRGLLVFKGRIKPQAVYDAWIHQDWAKLLAAIPWQEMNGDLGPAFQTNAKVAMDAWREVLPSLPAPAQPHLRVDLENPRIRHFIAQRSTRNFTALTQDSVDNIHEWVGRSFSQALTPRGVADGIKNSIGLLPLHARAVRKYEQGMRAQGVTPLVARARASAYADRLLDYRAMTIGRTETRLATNRGQLDVWRQAGDMGLIDRHQARKTWRVAGDPCEICAPMEGKSVPLDGFWEMPNGAAVDCPPDGSHPNCFCGFDVEY